MAYMSQDHKREINANLRPILKKHGLTGRLGVDNHSTLVLKITKGDVDFLTSYNQNRREDQAWKYPQWGEWKDVDHIDVNVYHYDKHFSEDVVKVLDEILPILNGEGTSRENFDESDAMVDYFYVGWYVNVRVGTWEKPYILNG